MGKFILKDKSYAFAIHIVKFCRTLQERHREFIITRQLIKCGTSVGAQVREAEFGQSRADYCHKLSIALKEANETDY